MHLRSVAVFGRLSAFRPYREHPRCRRGLAPRATKCTYPALGTWGSDLRAFTSTANLQPVGRMMECNRVNFKAEPIDSI